jgi:hypothetical protein
MMSGISRSSRPAWRHHPQLRLDCSQAMCAFSHRATRTPLRANINAADVPMMPPPITTTSVLVGRVSSGVMEST